MRYFKWVGNPSFRYVIIKVTTDYIHYTTPTGTNGMTLSHYRELVKKGEYKEYGFETYLQQAELL